MIIGWIFDYFEVENVFAVEIPEKFTMETRFDPKTGKKLPKKVKVVTQESRSILKYKDYEEDDVNLLLQSITNDHNIGIEYDSEYTNIFLGVWVPNYSSYETIITLKPSLERVKKELEGLGLKPKGSPKLYV